MPNSSNAPCLMTVCEVSDLLACSTRTVTSLIRKGHLPALRIGPGRSAYRVHSTDLDAFVMQYGEHQPATVADSDSAALPTFTPRPVRLVTERRADGLLLVNLYKPPVGLDDVDDEPAAAKDRTG